MKGKISLIWEFVCGGFGTVALGATIFYPSYGFGTVGLGATGPLWKYHRAYWLSPCCDLGEPTGYGMVFN